MADTELVIKIPDEEYQNYLKMRPAYPEGVFCYIKAIQNGTPLPEHHGRLIDADALPISHGVFVPRAANEVMLCTPTDAVFADEIKDAPTIIEGSDSE